MENDANLSAWDLAVSLYGRPGVRAACLSLQDRRGADVVALLALLHATVAGRAPPSEQQLRAALAEVAPWRAQAVLPLRAIRRALKGWRFSGAPAASAEAETARQVVAAAELAAERTELDVLSAALSEAGRPPGAADAADAAAALACYWRVAGLQADAEDCAHLAILLAAVFPMTAGAAKRVVDRAFGA
ncbi:MAG: TIGR02444 family protein [Alphaproteobacteria bacterium]|nr:TIGR02444 family protein [Alphaproteobacteria bacterium]